MDVAFAAGLFSIAGLTLDSFIGLFYDPEIYHIMTKRRSKEIKYGIWLTALGFGITDLPLSLIHFFSTGGHELQKSRQVDFLDWCQVYITNKFRLQYALLGVAVPCFIVVSCTITRLVLEVRKAEAVWAPGAAPDRRWVFRRFATTTFVLMLLFMVFWMPYAVLEMSILLLTAMIEDFEPPKREIVVLLKSIFRSWLLLGLTAIPVAYAIRFRRRVRRQLVDFFSAICSKGDDTAPDNESESDDNREAPTIASLLAASALTGYSFDDSKGSFSRRSTKRYPKKEPLSRNKSCMPGIGLTLPPPGPKKLAVPV